MTTKIADIASYQGSLTPEQLLAAGITAVNVKISDGLGTTSVHPKAGQWLADSRFERSTFHFLRPEIAGKDQATYAFSQLLKLAAPGPVAHVVDVETQGVTYPQVLDYCRYFSDLLDRPIAIYTGDWFWPASWDGEELSEWLWAAPNDSYRPDYPGDNSKDWRAGYGGWGGISVLQYSVKAVTQGGPLVSLSAVRDEALWDEMRGVGVATSQNGWAVATAAQQDDGKYAGVEFPNGALAGDVAYVFRWLIGQLDQRVEPIRGGTCWGWFVKNVAGSTTTISNHASGTAMDYNADQHPLDTEGTFSTSQVNTIHDILDEADGVFRWGGDYSGRKDPMHFEINKNAAAVKALRQKIEAAMELTTQNLSDIADVVWAKKVGSKAYPNRTVLQTLNDQGVDRDQDVDAAAAKITPVPAGSPKAALFAVPAAIADLLGAIASLQAKVDELAAQVGSIPAATVEITETTVETGVRNVLRDGVGTPQ